METNLTKDKELDKELDKDWLDLILEARNLGISADEIRSFLNFLPRHN